jgi:hypothetical protein
MQRNCVCHLHAFECHSIRAGVSAGYYSKMLTHAMSATPVAIATTSPSD